eukprot:gene8707-10328_t
MNLGDSVEYETAERHKIAYRLIPGQDGRNFLSKYIDGRFACRISELSVDPRAGEVLNQAGQAERIEPSSTRVHVLFRLEELAHAAGVAWSLKPLPSHTQASPPAGHAPAFNTYRPPALLTPQNATSAFGVPTPTAGHQHQSPQAAGASPVQPLSLPAAASPTVAVMERNRVEFMDTAGARLRFQLVPVFGEPPQLQMSREEAGGTSHRVTTLIVNAQSGEVRDRSGAGGLVAPLQPRIEVLAALRGLAVQAEVPWATWQDQPPVVDAPDRVEYTDTQGDRVAFELASSAGAQILQRRLNGGPARRATELRVNSLTGEVRDQRGEGGAVLPEHSRGPVLAKLRELAITARVGVLTPELSRAYGLPITPAEDPAKQSADTWSRKPGLDGSSPVSPRTREVGYAGALSRSPAPDPHRTRPPTPGHQTGQPSGASAAEGNAGSRLAQAGAVIGEDVLEYTQADGVRVVFELTKGLVGRPTLEKFVVGEWAREVYELRINGRTGHVWDETGQGGMVTPVEDQSKVLAKVQELAARAGVKCAAQLILDRPGRLDPSAAPAMVGELSVEFTDSHQDRIEFKVGASPATGQP